MNLIRLIQYFIANRKKPNNVINRQNQEEECKKLESQIGCPNKIVFIRILYPRCAVETHINVAELFSVILWDTLDNYRNKFVVKIDRKLDEIPSEIIADIRRKDCLVLIVVTEESFNQEKHPNYHIELQECKRLIIDKAKDIKLFLPILLLSAKDSVAKEELLYELLGSKDIVRGDVFLNDSLDFGLGKLRERITDVIDKRVRSLNN